MVISPDKSEFFRGFVITTDASIIAFTGVTASMILKHVLEKEKKKTAVLATVAKEGVQDFVSDYRKKRRGIIGFIEVILVALIGSILMGLGAIITETFVFNILLSLTFLLVGTVELVAMIVYSLEFEP